MQFFQDLGSLVEQRWRDKSYNEEAFPAIAAEALAEMNPNERVDPWEIIRWVSKTTQMPEQRDVDGSFGNPPITLFNGPRFYIDVYYWLDGTTSIHQHAFCGAFQVLMGSSILSQYHFEEEERINPHFSVGQMTLNKVELLEEGNVRQIATGKQYIHSLFHLDRPSASIIIRTSHSPGGLPQFNYVKPCFAIDPFFKEALMIKRVQSASLLLQMKHPEADEMIGEMLACSDFQTAFALLNLAYNSLPNDQMEKAFGLSTGKERFEGLLEIARRRHGEISDLIVPALQEIQRQQNLIYRRGQITSNEHRFFLALLLNVPDRARVLDLVRQRFPEQNPVDTITDWVEELANTKMVGSSESNVLGIDNLDGDYLFAFQCLLEGLTLEQIKSRFEEELSEEGAASSENNPEELYNTIRNSMPFKSIFLDHVSSERGKTAYDALKQVRTSQPDSLSSVC
jgi:hypothetical protein